MLQRCLELGSRDNMTIVLADLRQRRRCSRKANPMPQHPLQPLGPPSRSSAVPSAGEGSEGVGVVTATLTPSPTEAAAAAAAAVGGEAVSVSAVKLEGELDPNRGAVCGAEVAASCLAVSEPGGEEGGSDGGSSGPTSVDPRNQGSVRKAGFDVAAATGEKVAVEPPEPPGELAMRTQAQAHVPSRGMIVGGIGDAGGSSSTAGRAGAAAAAAGGDAVVGEALLKEERPGLLLPPGIGTVDGDDGVIGAAGGIVF